MPVMLRFLNVQGIAGLAVSLALALLLVVQKGETRHWKKQSSAFEQLYAREQAAFKATAANYRAAAERARADDLANLERVTAEQRAINQRSSNDYQTRLAAARLSAQRLREQTASAAANSGSGRAAPMSALPAAAGRADRETGEDGFPRSERLIATEQAIQLDELIKWVKAQAAVEPTPKSSQ